MQIMLFSRIIKLSYSTDKHVKIKYSFLEL